MAADETTGAILTPKQRILTRGNPDGELDYDRSYERTVRSRIRERIRTGMFDLSLLLEHTTQEDLEQTFDVIDNKEAHKTGLSAGLTDGVAFMIAANAAAGRGTDITDGEWYTALLSEAIQRALRHSGIVANHVGVEIEIEGITPLDEFDTEDLASMSIGALRQRYFAGMISEEDFDRAIEEKIESRLPDETTGR